MDSPLGALRTSVDRLHQLVRGLDEAQLEEPSYCEGWTVADVLSHLGAGAVMARRRMAVALEGAVLPEDFAQPIWDEWNAKSPRTQADDALIEDERVLEDFEAVPGAERAGLAVPLGPLRVSYDDAVALWLNEHAIHTWDVEVVFDPDAHLPHEVAAVMIDNLGLVAGFTARPADDEREVRVRTSHPERHFTVRLSPGGSELLAGDAGARPDVELPAEAFCRLVYGRLDPDHSPPVAANGEVLDLLRRVFPGL